MVLRWRKIPLHDFFCKRYEKDNTDTLLNAHVHVAVCR